METNSIIFITQSIEDLLKTCIFFNILILDKNIGTNLLNCKKFVFVTFIFDKLENIIDIPEGFFPGNCFMVYKKKMVN